MDTDEMLSTTPAHAGVGQPSGTGGVDPKDSGSSQMNGERPSEMDQIDSAMAFEQKLKDLGLDESVYPLLASLGLDTEEDFSELSEEVVRTHQTLHSRTNKNA